ncbi:MAG: carbohydrate kinase, partial [Alphaproteobacteria bacterium]
MLLCCGEALIDMLPGRTDAGEDAFVPHAGGAVFNTAIALGRLGASAAMVTGLSNDLFGQKLEASLAASGVDATLAVRSDRPTTLAFVTLKGGQASYTFYDEN